jgi:fused signal recognition particle receptor
MTPDGMAPVYLCDNPFLPSSLSARVSHSKHLAITVFQPSTQGAPLKLLNLKQQPTAAKVPNSPMIQTLFGSLNEPEKKSIFDRMKQAVTKTRDNLSEKIDTVIALTREVDEASLEELEMVLISSDIGVTTSAEIITALRERAKRKQIESGAELKHLLKEHLKAILDEHQKLPANVPPPLVIMLVGVNGTGKTTTTGKLAAHFRRDAKTVLLCAADTFRAAAIEQLEVWGERSGVEMIKTKPGGDPSAVLYDALQAAKARHTDVVIIDTAGRLHTKNSLMAELDKMRRTAQRLIPTAPHEVLLVMDATTGQNGLQQARLFTESAGVTGIVLTKLDGTAKGGIAVAIARELQLPVRYVGVGEKLEDLLPFDSEAFTESLLGG